MAAQGAVGGGAHLPELVIEGTRSPTTRAALAELWLHRGLVLAFAIRDVKVKYKQAILGVAWAVVQPLGLLVLFTLLVARAVTIRETDVPYPAFALSALIPWLFLQNAVVAGTGALLADSALVRKIRSEEHTSELQSLTNLVCRLLLEKKKQSTDTDFVTGDLLDGVTVSYG